MRLAPAPVPAASDAVADGRTGPVQEAVARILPRFGPTALHTLSEAGARDRIGSHPPNIHFMWNAAIRAAADMGEPAAAPLAAMFARPGYGTDRYFAQYTLKKLGPPAVEVLRPWPRPRRSDPKRSRICACSVAHRGQPAGPS